MSGKTNERRGRYQQGLRGSWSNLPAKQEEVDPLLPTSTTTPEQSFYSGTDVSFKVSPSDGSGSPTRSLLVSDPPHLEVMSRGNERTEMVSGQRFALAREQESTGASDHGGISSTPPPGQQLVGEGCCSGCCFCCKGQTPPVEGDNSNPNTPQKSCWERLEASLSRILLGISGIMVSSGQVVAATTTHPVVGAVLSGASVYPALGAGFVTAGNLSKGFETASEERKAIEKKLLQANEATKKELLATKEVLLQAIATINSPGGK